MKRPLVIAAIAVFLCVFGVLAYTYMQSLVVSSNPSGEYAPVHTIHIGGMDVHVTIAQTESERERGLGGRIGLKSDEGMLFVFPKDGLYAFWMKDMRFAIDIIWISAKGVVVHVAENVSPDTYPASFGTQSPARYVLEVPAGFVDAHGIKLGDIVGL